MRKKNERAIFYKKRSGLHGRAWAGIAFFVVVALCANYAYFVNCNFANHPCQIGLGSAEE